MKIPEVGELFKTLKDQPWLIEGHKKPHHLPKNTIMVCTAVNESLTDGGGSMLVEFSFMTSVGVMIWTSLHTPFTTDFAVSIRQLNSALERIT